MRYIAYIYVLRTYFIYVSNLTRIY